MTGQTGYGPWSYDAARGLWLHDHVDGRQWAHFEKWCTYQELDSRDREVRDDRT